MKPILLTIAIMAATYALFAQEPVENYPVDAASVVQPGVPKGEVLKFTFDHSTIFPGTWREYWIYIPASTSPISLPVCTLTRMAYNGMHLRYSTTLFTGRKFQSPLGFSLRRAG